MKKLLVVFSAVAAGLAIWAPARAITPTTATIDCSAQGAQGPFNFSGQVGESFTLVNTGLSACNLAAMAGVVTPSGAGFLNGAFGPQIAALGTATFTIVAAGTFTVTTVAGTGTAHAVAITLYGGNGGPSGPATLVESSLDANGGSCLFGGTVRSKYDSTTIGYSYAPGNDECARSQCVLVGWNVSSSATTPVPANLPLLKVDDTLAKRAFVAKSGDFVADWVQAPKFSDISLPTNGSTNLRWDSGCRGVVRFDAAGACRLSVGQSFQSGTSSIVTAEGSMWIFVGSQAGSCEITATPVFTAYQNLDGTLPVTTSASSLPSSTFTVTVEAPRSIVIVGERTTVSGKSGICISGETTGFDTGARIIPYLRFPGETTFTQGSARPEVRSDGSFEWCRKTGKKTYVYFTSADGSVTSNRVIIPAA